MSFNPAGFGLSMIVLTIVAGQFIAHKWVKKVTNCYFFWAVIGAMVTTYLIAFRFRFAWHDLAVAGPLNLKDYDDAYTFSKALLLDICPFCGLLLPITLMADPTRYSCRALAPLALIGGLFTILCDIPTSSDPAWTFEYIFLGIGKNHCYFMMHALNLILAIGVLLNTPKYGWKGYLVAVGTAVLFYSYVGIMMGATGISWFVSGLSINDWATGEYSQVAQVLHCSPTVAACVGLPGMFVITSGLLALNDYVFKRWIWTYGNAKSKKWYFWYNYTKFDKNRFW